MISRRQLLQAASVTTAQRAFADTDRKLSPNLGGAPAGFPMRARAARAASKPFDFIEHCHNLGLGVVETRLDHRNPDAIREFRNKTERWNMRAIVGTPLPREQGDVPAYEAAVRAAKEAGVIGFHAAMTQRRYEQYDSLDAFRSDFERCQRSVALAEPVLRKYKLRLGIENHKGWRAAEQAAWMKRLSSEWVGVHFDFGNNVALCEDPADTLRILRPYAIACHIKDMAVEPYADGFLLSEVPLGDGFLDLKAMVQSLRGKDPNIPFNLEMITRDPLNIPVYTERYWVTFDDSYSPMPARDLAKTLNIVRTKKPAYPLQRPSALTEDAQLRLENENIAKSIACARTHLGL
ncbi:MAG TPA: TIM barrel protein [Bryobacteraceae bacterium]|nr:TIM barrel protein [Bryobacteraceae bacterium]